MNDREVDARGLSCPVPVLKTKEALEKIDEGVITVLVDNQASCENVRRFAESQGCAVEVSDKEGTFVLTIAKGYTCSLPSTEGSQELRKQGEEGVTFLITSDSIGPEEELGSLLMRAFIATLTEASRLPKRILFLNRGVFLTLTTSSVLEPLRELEKSGVELYSCGTCLEFFGVKDQLGVGVITNMYDTVERLTSGDKVVTIG